MKSHLKLSTDSRNHVLWILDRGYYCLLIEQPYDFEYVSVQN
jgi:hypothetical protein